MTIQLHDLTVSYDRHPAIHHLSGSFASGSLTAIAGPNGAGKSTLLKALARIMKPSTGHIEFNSLERNEIAYMPQSSETNRDFPLTVLQFICIAYWRAFRPVSHQQKESAKFALASVGLTEFEDRPIGTLSNGQFQRMLFARVILQDAKLILLDEPFSAVDTETTSRLLQIIQKWHGENRTVICALHDLEQIKKHFPECVLLARKCIAWGNSNFVLSSDNLFSAKLFHEAWQENAEVCAT